MRAGAGRADPRPPRGGRRGGTSALNPTTVAGEQVEVTKRASQRRPALRLDAASGEWLRSLRAEGAVRDDAVARLHALLLRAARFELARRRPTMAHVRGDDLDDIAHESADDALMSCLPASMTSAVRAASLRGPTSSPCSRRR